MLMATLLLLSAQSFSYSFVHKGNRWTHRIGLTTQLASTSTATKHSLSHRDLPENTLYVLDGTAMMYRSYFGRESQSRYGRVVTSPEYGSMPCGALAAFSATFARLIRDIQPKYLATTFDTGKTFRNDIFPSYKQNRQKSPDDLPKQLQLAPSIIQSYGCRCLWYPGFEADDVMASLASLAKRCNRTVVLVSADKDLLQLVDDNGNAAQNDDTRVNDGTDKGYVYVMNPQSMALSGTREVLEKYGVPPQLLCDVMALIGDSADNIPGIKGVGLKSAAALVNAFGSLENIFDMIKESQSNSASLLVQVSEALRSVRVSPVKILEALQKCDPAEALLYKDLIVLRRNIDLSQLSRPAENSISATLYTDQDNFATEDAYLPSPSGNDDTAARLESLRYYGQCAPGAADLANSLAACQTFSKILKNLEATHATGYTST